jgi:hypothetical protein
MAFGSTPHGARRRALKQLVGTAAASLAAPTWAQASGRSIVLG